MKLLLFIAFAAITAVSTKAEQISPEWQGKWLYEECWKHISGERTDCVIYELEVFQDHTKGIPLLSINGTMSGNEVEVYATATGCGISIKFIKNTENAIFSLDLKRDEVLFNLCKENGKTITEWVNLEPNIETENEVYFIKQ